MPIFSAESSTIDPTIANGNKTFNFFGDYLWFNGLTNTIPTGSTQDVNTGFITNYNSDDPYYAPCNGVLTVPNCSATISPLCSCTDHANQPTSGNIIEGVVWFKYGLMPFKDGDISLYMANNTNWAGFPGATVTLTLNNNFNVINQAQFEDVCNGYVITPLAAITYNWYKRNILWLNL